jgi:hypothetical protein
MLLNDIAEVRANVPTGVKTPLELHGLSYTKFKVKPLCIRSTDNIKTGFTPFWPKLPAY